jgi:hypothetical protein
MLRRLPDDPNGGDPDVMVETPYVTSTWCISNVEVWDGGAGYVNNFISIERLY